MKYGQIIRWTKGNTITQVRVSECNTRKEALEDALKSAIYLGWPGNPKWWQWWRKNDTKVNFED